MIHVIPLNDTREHVDSVHCHCRPTVQDKLVIHHAYDKRELIERLKEESSPLIPDALLKHIDLKSLIGEHLINKGSLGGRKR